MAIEVVKKGTPPMDKKYEGDCNNCKSTLRFLRSDVKQESSPKNECYYIFKCPVCKKDLYLDINSVREIKE